MFPVKLERVADQGLFLTEEYEFSDAWTNGGGGVALLFAFSVSCHCSSGRNRVLRLATGARCMSVSQLTHWLVPPYPQRFFVINYEFYLILL